MDRTNWKFGEFNINILMLGITYKGIAFPLIFSLLPKRGNSNWEERKKIMERFIRLFERNASTALWQTASSSERNGQDGSTAAAYGITSEYVRTSGLSSLPPSERIRAWWLFNDLKVGQEKFFHTLFLHKGEYVYLA